MHPHTVSAPIPVPKGYWVVKADEASPVAARTFEASRASIHDHLADQERQTRFASWLTGQLRTADVRVNGRYGHWPQDFLLSDSSRTQSCPERCR